MLNICIPSQSRQSIGGGWSFRRNLEKGIEIVGGAESVPAPEADIILIAGASMLMRPYVNSLKKKGKKIVLRVDNALRNSRNRSTGMSRMYDYAQIADAVIYQSAWARDYLGPFLKREEGRVIYNGVDLDVFKPKGPYKDFSAKGQPIFIYSRYNRDESKMWIKAWYEYQKIQRNAPKAFLVIVGRFSDKLREGKFDFFANENFEYIGVMTEPEQMAQVLRGCDYMLATYYNDCFSNTYLEALACGVELYKPDLSGGTEEMLALWKEKGKDYFSLERMAKEYLEVFNELL